MNCIFYYSNILPDTICYVVVFSQEKTDLAESILLLDQKWTMVCLTKSILNQKNIFYQNITLKNCLDLNISLNKNVYQNLRLSVCQNMNHILDQNVTQKYDKICMSKYEPNTNDSGPKSINILSSEEKKVKIHK